MRCVPLSFFTCLLAASTWAQPAADHRLACEIPVEYVTPSAPLPTFQAALTANRPVEILALGSGSTVGDVSGAAGAAFAGKTPGESFPFRMLDALRALRPGSRFNLTVAGGRNMTAEEMLGVLNQHLGERHYDLLLWQTGTVEAVRGLRPEAFHDVLETGIAAAAARHVDVVLVDPQFSRFLRANIDLDPYEWVMQQTADNNNVALFRRFALTQAWVTSGEVDLERVGRDAREKTVALLNTCLGQALAAYLLGSPQAR